MIPAVIREKYYSARRCDEKQTDLQEFASAIVSMAAPRRLYGELFRREKTAYLKQIGCLYEDVAWENHAQELRPDYVIYDPIKGEIRITEKLLREWAE